MSRGPYSQPIRCEIRETIQEQIRIAQLVDDPNIILPMDLVSKIKPNPEYLLYRLEELFDPDHVRVRRESRTIHRLTEFVGTFGHIPLYEAEPYAQRLIHEHHNKVAMREHQMMKSAAQAKPKIIDSDRFPELKDLLKP